MEWHFQQRVGHPHTLSAVRPNTIVHVVHAFDLSARHTRDYFWPFESTRIFLSTAVQEARQSISLYTGYLLFKATVEATLYCSAMSLIQRIHDD